ncbi:MAG: hypothetical protein ACR2PL_06670 [Dehalococcoidia bacterium]
MKLLGRSATIWLLTFIFLGSSAGSVRPALAQQQVATDSQPDLVPVMLWTATVCLLAMGTLALFYLYRRTRGSQDELIPKTVDPFYAEEGRAEKHETGEPHPEMAHDSVGMHADEPPASRVAITHNITAPDPSGVPESAPSESSSITHEPAGRDSGPR